MKSEENSNWIIYVEVERDWRYYVVVGWKRNQLSCSEEVERD